MKYIIAISLFVLSCKSKVIKGKEQSAADIRAEIHSNFKTIDSLATKIQSSQTRLFFVISNIQKRDSFLFKKYEYEAHYYQSGEDQYRVKANRMIDSANKYVRIIDSVKKTLK